MGWRLILVVFVLGGTLFGWGFSEHKLAAGAQEAPVPITLAELEKGSPENPYRTLGEHIPVTALVVYQEDQKTHKIDHAYYPVVTQAELDEATRKVADQKHVSADEVDGKDVVAAMPIKVVVETTRFHDKPALQDAIQHDKLPTKNVTGSVVNRVHSIDGEQARLLRDSYKNLDTETVIIFEEGRTPKSGGTTAMAMGGGVLIMLGGVVGVLKRKRR